MDLLVLMRCTFEGFCSSSYTQQNDTFHHGQDRKTLMDLIFQVALLNDALCQGYKLASQDVSNQ